MKKYQVTIPIAGFVCIEVEVPEEATEDEIFNAACETYCGDESAGHLEWDFHKRLARGNVLYASVNEWTYE